MNKNLYSLRMHATRHQGHLSGAERLAVAEDLEWLAGELVKRALRHPRGCAEHIRLSIDLIPHHEIRTGRLLDLRTVRVFDYQQGRAAARQLLIEAGVGATAVDAAMKWMMCGAAPDGRSMRGAMVVDALSGARIEDDPARGVRVSRMDLTAIAERELRRKLAEQELDNPHVREALVLATKVLSAPQVIAELCWSDDPCYTAGYVTSRKQGYVRFPYLKPIGDERGGRAFFVHGKTLNYAALADYLERAVLLIDRLGEINGVSDWRG